MSTREDLPGDQDPREVPPTNTATRSKPKRPPPSRTPAQAAALRYLPAAIAGNWSAREFSRQAGICERTAMRFLSQAHQQIAAQSQQALGFQSQQLAMEARKARDRAIGRLENLGEAVDAAAAKLKRSGRRVDVRDLASAVKAAKDLHTHVEQLTGLDVAKSLAIKAGAGSDGIPISWDGVAAISVKPALPEPVEAGE